MNISTTDSEKAYTLPSKRQQIIQFNKSTISWISDRALFIFRIFTLMVMTFVAVVNTSYNWKMTVYYESEWSFVGSTISLFCILMADRSRFWHHAATYTSEFALAYNFIVTVCLWASVFAGLMPKSATKFIP